MVLGAGTGTGTILFDPESILIIIKENKSANIYKENKFHHYNYFE